MKRILLILTVLLFSHTAHADLESWMGIPIADLETIAGVPVVDLEAWAGQTIPVAGGGVVTYRSSDFGSGASTDTVVVTMPAVSDGDMIIAYSMSESNNGTDSALGAFTEITNTTALGDTSYAYYRVASSEPATYTWTFDASASGQLIFIVVLEKTAGTWVTPTTAGYSDTAQENATGVTCGPLDIAAGATLVNGLRNDNIYTISTPPTDMTVGEAYQGVGTMGGVVYYQEYASLASSVSKTVVWSGSAQNDSIMVVVEAE